MKKQKITILCVAALTVLSLPAFADEIVIEGDLKVEESLIVIGDNGVMFKGAGPVDWNIPGPGTIPDDSDDSRFMWYPAKAALRFGDPMDAFGNPENLWEDQFIGLYSAAWGIGTTATGFGATAWGSNTGAHGWLSTVWGGDMTYAIGGGATAWGDVGFASGVFSTVWGVGSSSTGFISTAWGEAVSAESTNSTALGRLNVGGGHPTEWIETDPLFEIGNGSDNSNLSNALTVLKNGQTILANKFWDEQDPITVPSSSDASGGRALVVMGHSQFEGNIQVAGPVRIQPAGDISMGSFTAGP